MSEDSRTSWTAPNSGYEDALGAFVAGTPADRGFLDDLEAFVAPLVAPGRVTSLAQTLLKLTAPGVPDLYQGTELWDLSLVDPDTRRPVDYELRRRCSAPSTTSPRGDPRAERRGAPQVVGRPAGVGASPTPFRPLRVGRIVSSGPGRRPPRRARRRILTA